MNNIKNVYQHVGKCDDQQILKDILYAAMVLTPQEVTGDISNVPMTSTPVKKQVLVIHCVFSPTY